MYSRAAFGERMKKYDIKSIEFQGCFTSCECILTLSKENQSDWHGRGCEAYGSYNETELGRISVIFSPSNWLSSLDDCQKKVDKPYNGAKKNYNVQLNPTTHIWTIA